MNLICRIFGHMWIKGSGWCQRDCLARKPLDHPHYRGDE